MVLALTSLPFSPLKHAQDGSCVRLIAILSLEARARRFLRSPHCHSLPRSTRKTVLALVSLLFFPLKHAQDGSCVRLIAILSLDARARQFLRSPHRHSLPRSTRKTVLARARWSSRCSHVHSLPRSTRKTVLAFASLPFSPSKHAQDGSCARLIAILSLDARARQFLRSPHRHSLPRSTRKTVLALVSLL